MTFLVERKCAECDKSLNCTHCGMFKWTQVRMIDNAVDPWYFCSEKCKEKFAESLEKRA